MALKNFADISEDKIKEILSIVGGDGHSIYPIEFFLDKFDVPRNVIEYCEHTLFSDPSNPKSTIYKGGEEVESVTGVFTLDLHYRIAEDLGLSDIIAKAGSLKGRGFQAQELCNGIMEYLNETNLEA